MKNVLPIMFCLLGMNSAFSQAEVKGFLEGSYFQYESLVEDDSTYFYKKEKRFVLRPSFALSFYRVNQAFHEIGITNIYIDNKDYDRQSGSTPSVQTKSNRASFDFRYNYNYCILKDSKRWLPYIGLQTNHQFDWSGSEQGTNQVQNMMIRSRVGLAAGLQYKLKDRFRLELQLPVDLAQFTYQRQNSVSSQVLSGQVRQFVDINSMENPFLAIPIRLGVAVRI